MIVIQVGQKVGVDIGDKILFNDAHKKFFSVRDDRIEIIGPVIIAYPIQYTYIAELK